MSQEKPYVDKDGFTHQFLPNVAPKRKTRLVAAAPDMLRLLKAFVASSLDSHLANLFKEEARAIIAKAEGRNNVVSAPDAGDSN